MPDFGSSPPSCRAGRGESVGTPSFAPEAISAPSAGSDRNIAAPHLGADQRVDFGSRFHFNKTPDLRFPIGMQLAECHRNRDKGNRRGARFTETFGKNEKAFYHRTGCLAANHPTEPRSPSRGGSS